MAIGDRVKVGHRFDAIVTGSHRSPDRMNVEIAQPQVASPFRHTR
jgi:hypothetical protein